MKEIWNYHKHEVDVSLSVGNNRRAVRRLRSLCTLPPTRRFTPGLWLIMWQIRCLPCTLLACAMKMMKMKMFFFQWSFGTFWHFCCTAWICIYFGGWPNIYMILCIHNAQYDTCYLWLNILTLLVYTQNTLFVIEHFDPSIVHVHRDVCLPWGMTKHIWYCVCYL